MKEVFYQQGKNRASKRLLDYVWNEAFMLSAGYSFSQIHSAFYSLIAIQQAVLNVKYDPIYWNTARLLVESSSVQFLNEQLDFVETEEEEEEEKEKKKNSSVDYFKMASAIGAIRNFGVEIAPPNINKSNFTFKPDAEQNKIWFGIKGVSRIGDQIIHEIMSKRPYSSLQDFLSKVKVNKIQATMLIKSGAFDEFNTRENLINEYCDSQADKKKQLNLQNAQRLIDLELFPESLKEYQDIYKLTKHLKKYFKFGDLIVPDQNMWNYIRMFDFDDIKVRENEEYIEVSSWEKWYKKKMDVLRDYIKSNHDELLEKVNKAAVDELLNKYGQGNIAQWEMEALSYYHGVHELEYPEYREWLEKLRVVGFEELDEEPYIEWEGSNGAKKFELHRIVGTAIGRDKQKGIVGLLTPSGFLKVKVHKSMFLRLDKQIKDESGTEKSWFSKGTKLLLSGYRLGDEFKVKIYKNHPHGQAIYKIDTPGQLTSKRKGEI